MSSTKSSKFLAKQTDFREPALPDLDMKKNADGPHIDESKPTLKLREKGSIPSRRRSPPDKPLPSLPITTVRPSSPIVRRSLIDASEKPLRRSLSPSPGSAKQEDWPTINPSRGASADMLPTPSFKDSSELTTDNGREYQGVSQNAEDVSSRYMQNPKAMEGENITSKAALIPFDDHKSIKEVDGKAKSLIKAPGVFELRGNKSANTTSGRSAGLAAVEKVAPDQMALSRSLSHQTRRSSTRARLSAGSTTSLEGSSRTKQHMPTADRLSPSINRANSKPGVVSKHLSIPGPVRSLLRTRKAVTAKGSPYRYGVRSSSQSVNISTHRANGKADHNSRHAMRPSSSPNSGTQMSSRLIASRGTKVSYSEGRKSSIPVSRRSMRGRAGENSEGELHCGKQKRMKSFGKICDMPTNLAEDADVDTDRESIKVQSKHIFPTLHEGVKDQEFSQSDSESENRDAYGARDIVAPPQLPDITSKDLSNTSPFTTNDSDLGSFGSGDDPKLLNYRVKRLSLAAPEHGPKLRIAEAAEKVIMGGDTDDEDQNMIQIPEKTNTLSDLRRSMVIKEQFRKGTESLLKGHLPLSRSTTSRSLSKVDLEPSSALDSRLRRYSTDHDSVHKVEPRLETDGNSGGWSVTNEDPFVDLEDSKHPKTGGGLVETGGGWPLKKGEAPKAELKTVVENSEEGEDGSWIPIMPTAATDLDTSKEIAKVSASASVSQVPINTSITIESPKPDLRNEARFATHFKSNSDKPLDDVSGSRRHSACPVSGSRRQSAFPPRNSSRNQAPSQAPRVVSRPGNTTAVSQLHCPEIPNRFASVRSTMNIKEQPLLPAKNVEAEALHKSGTEHNNIGTWALHDYDGPSSTKSQISASKGMLSNFRGLFQKKSPESNFASSAHKQNDSAQRKAAFVRTNGSPFPFTKTHFPTSKSSSKNYPASSRVTPTPASLFSSLNATNGTPTFDTPEPDEMQRATRLAMEVLESARNESNANRKAKLVEVSLSLLVVNLLR